MDYQYDVFLSYRRDPPVGEWVSNHFYPELMKWLPLEVNRVCSVFKDIEVLVSGAIWPQTIRKALMHSRCMLCIWSPDYFWHEWCVAEWKSMVERERLLGLASAANPIGLVVPVVFHDGQNFPREARDVQGKDFRDYNTSVPAFAQTVKYVDFIGKVKDLARELAGVIIGAPAWQNDWPTLTPQPYNRPTTQLPRL